MSFKTDFCLVANTTLFKISFPNMTHFFFLLGDNKIDSPWTQQSKLLILSYLNGSVQLDAVELTESTPQNEVHQKLIKL
jgi:hypothetical protein